ncbi:hypothetical protein ISF6_4281 [Piscinibacter sakaiensis]|uniref:Uncharacterized protein n=1 Tax=Piscinibacter sakaiensis TaxID=1547922 RepID=A0A0K8P656_PISS1|nr:hypothetical protein ISF6_4281 [Piscinibacter sakaiensis]
MSASGQGSGAGASQGARATGRAGRLSSRDAQRCSGPAGEARAAGVASPDPPPAPDRRRLRDACGTALRW